MEIFVILPPHYFASILEQKFSTNW